MTPSAHHPSPLMPERGGLALPHVAAASSALSRFRLPGAAQLSPASVGEPFHPHPPHHAADLCRPDAEAPAAFAGRLLDIRPIEGLACQPMRLSGVGRMGARAV